MGEDNKSRCFCVTFFDLFGEACPLCFFVQDFMRPLMRGNSRLVAWGLVWPHHNQTSGAVAACAMGVKRLLVLYAFLCDCCNQPFMERLVVALDGGKKLRWPSVRRELGHIKH